jgi:hypothetical protein
MLISRLPNLLRLEPCPVQGLDDAALVNIRPLYLGLKMLNLEGAMACHYKVDEDDSKSCPQGSSMSAYGGIHPRCQASTSGPDPGGAEVMTDFVASTAQEGL